MAAAARARHSGPWAPKPALFRALRPPTLQPALSMASNLCCLAVVVRGSAIILR
jgi:hypothetical protein